MAKRSKLRVRAMPLPPLPAPILAPEPARPEGVMYHITGIDSAGRRAAAYHSELEQLAVEVDDLLGVLRESTDEKMSFVVRRLDHRLNMIYAAGVPKKT